LKRPGVFTFLLLAISFLLLFSACQNQGQSIGVNSSGSTAPGSPGSASQESENPNEITMAVFFPVVSHLDKAAKLYEEKTGISVNIKKSWEMPEWEEFEVIDKWGVPSTEAILLNPSDTSVYTEQALASLMTGRGADIYDVRSMDFEHLGRNGLLINMSDWLENDAELSDDLVFRDILLSGKTADGIFAVPVDFAFRKLAAVTADEPVLGNKRMTWQEFIGEVSELEYTQDIAYRLTDLDIFMERFISKASFFIDENGNSQILYSDEMISLLEECRDWSSAGLCKGYGDPASWASSYSYGASFITYRPAEALCTLPEGFGRSSLCFAPMLFDGDPVVKDGKPLYPELNDGLSIYGVNAGSAKTEVALDFLRFLLSKEGQNKMWLKDGTGGFALPLNRSVFRNMVESDLERIQTSVNASNTFEIDIPSLIKEAEGTVDQIAYIIYQKPYYNTIIREVAKQFFLDQISAEEAARQMSDKVGLYLKEQG